MLTHSDFYTDSVKSGLVRTPVEYVVALMVATGKRSREANVTWLMEAMGQRLLFPPNVSGWRPNGYWVNASAMEGRARTAQSFFWTSNRNYWSGDDGPITLAGGSIMRSEITARTPWPEQLPVLTNAAFVDRLLALTHRPACVDGRRDRPLRQRRDGLGTERRRSSSCSLRVHLA